MNFLYALAVLALFIGVPILIVLGASIFYAAKQGDEMMSKWDEDDRRDLP